MSDATSRPFLPAIMGFLHQERAEGELILTQNDGVRRLYFQGGDLRYLKSDAGGEQFGNYLIRQGVIDYNALKALLAKDGARVGERVVAQGLMSAQQRDEHLHDLLSAILLRALEHPILHLEWRTHPLNQLLSRDLQFELDHRRLVWKVFQDLRDLSALPEALEAQPGWRWCTKSDLLSVMSDLPLTPQMAYALSLLGPAPMAFDTLRSVTGLDAEECARLMLILWAFGGVELVEGEVKHLTRAMLQAKPPAPEPEPEVEILPESEPETDEQSHQVRPGLFSSPPPSKVKLELETPPPTPRRGTPVVEPPPPSPPPPPPAQLGRASQLEPPPRSSMLHDFLPPKADPEGTRPGLSRTETDPGTDPAAQPADTPERRARRLFKQAESLMLQERHSEAIRALEESTRLDGASPKSYDAWMLLGRLRTANPAWSARAIEALQQASHARPHSAEPWVLMGEIYHRKGFGANATGCFRKALELDPSMEVPEGISVTETHPGQPKEDPGLFGRIKGLLKSDKK